MNPKVVGRLKIIVTGLEAWLAGEPGKTQAVRDVVKLLGKPKAYREKIWLARCLHHVLGHHTRSVGY